MKIFSPILKGTTTVVQGTTNLSGSFTGSLFGTAATASYADNFTVGGTLTAQTINVQIITSSIEFNTGSTRNGALSSNTHQFTGSVLMSGSLTVGSSIMANNTISAYLGTIAAGNTPATSGTTPVNAMLNLTNNRGIGMYFGGKYSGDYAQWIQVSDTGNLAVNYPLLLNPNGGNVGINTTTPAALLQIGASANTESNIFLARATSNANTVIGGIRAALGPYWYDATSTSYAEINFESDSLYYRGAISFRTNNSDATANRAVERMRITSGGVVQISNAGDAQLQLNASGATGYVRYTNSSGDIWGTGIGFNIATNFELYNFTTSTYGFRVTRSGIYATTATSPRSVFVQSDGTLGGISSVRESKTNITSLDSSWLMQLNPVSFNYRKKDTEDKYTNEHYDELFYGLIAEEVESVNKEICTYNDDKLIGIEYTKIIPVLVKAIQELKAENDTLKEILQRNNIQ